MSTPTISIASLHAQLTQLQQVLKTDEHALAERIVTDHAEQLQQYLQQDGADISRETLQKLLQRQQAVTAQMVQLRDEAAAWLRANRYFNNATRLYSQAGLLR
ncbi:hypothetical protein [Xanthomonas albilineans]|uniref:hypothetical protein n=1 Tax=Xanthomonas albilineans TaxID=29447 RepID=UPI0005F33CAD|nr:hypothetical protein [Xanthomonas albilineans]PPU95040.1 hypothetical protein XalbCFBP2523_01070 [Xanthomonas albilineans]